MLAQSAFHQYISHELRHHLCCNIKELTLETAESLRADQLSEEETRRFASRTRETEIVSPGLVNDVLDSPGWNQIGFWKFWSRSSCAPAH